MYICRIITKWTYLPNQHLDELEHCQHPRRPPPCAPLNTNHALFLQVTTLWFQTHKLVLPVFGFHINGICNMYSFGAVPITQYYASEIHPCCSVCRLFICAVACSLYHCITICLFFLRLTGTWLVPIMASLEFLRIPCLLHPSSRLHAFLLGRLMSKSGMVGS